MCVLGSNSKTLYWKIGMLEYWVLYLTTLFQYSNIAPFHHSIPYFHGLGSNGFTPISNNAGPGCARARFKAGCKSRGCSMRSP
jgi:hypothetical protein